MPRLARDRAWVGEAVATRKDGTTFDQGISLTLTEEGLLICVCEDISDRKAAERALHTSQTFLQTVLETAPLAIFWKDLQGVYQGGKHPNRRNFWSQDYGRYHSPYRCPAGLAPGPGGHYSGRRPTDYRHGQGLSQYRATDDPEHGSGDLDRGQKSTPTKRSRADCRDFRHGPGYHHPQTSPKLNYKI